MPTILPCESRKLHRSDGGGDHWGCEVIETWQMLAKSWMIISNDISKQDHLSSDVLAEAAGDREYPLQLHFRSIVASSEFRP